MQKTFDTPGPASLYVEIGSGSLTVRTDDVATTTVDVLGRDAENVTVEQRGEQIVVLGPPRRGGFLTGNGDLTVTVVAPHDSRIATRLGSADLVARGRLGEAAVKAGSGDVAIQRVDGEASVETGSGDVRLGEVTGDLVLKSGSGGVTVDRLGAAASLSTGSGDIRVGVSENGVQLKSGSGDAHVVESHGDIALSTASGDITVERAHRGELRASNVSGDITLGVPGGIPVWTDVSTVTGSVTSTLVGAGEPTEGQDFVALHAKSVSGDVHLEQR